MSTNTRIVIAGIGGVGGYFGGMLARHYHDYDNVDIIFFSRGEHLKAIQDSGLHVMHGDHSFVARPTLATDNPSEVGNADYLIIATKSYDLDSVLAQLRPCINPNTLILPLLNGVDNRERILHQYPDNEVIHGCVYLVSRLKKAGVIENTGNIEKLFFGMDNITSEPMQALERILKAAGIDATLSANISPIIWEKLIFLSPTATATTWFDSCIGELLSDDEKRNTIVALIQEVRRLALAMQIMIPEDIVDRTLNKLQALPFEATSSMHSDFRSGKANTELESITGYVVREALKHKVATPMYTRLYEGIKKSSTQDALANG